MIRALGLIVLLLAGCERAADVVESVAPWKGQPGSTSPNAAGLVTLPCDGSGHMAAMTERYCRARRNYMTPTARDALLAAGEALAARYPGEVLRYMDGSGEDGIKPFPPHFSHGDGRQVDLALYFETLDGKPMGRLPDTRSWGGWWPSEPPRPGAVNLCPDGPNGRQGRAWKPDPPADRNWRLDEARTKALVQILIADPRVKRILIEPHLERRFGLEGHPKLRFAGCKAARHDDHLHVDFH